MNTTCIPVRHVSNYLIALFIVLVSMPWVLLSYQTFAEEKQEYLRQLSLRLNMMAVDRERSTRQLIERRERSLAVLARDPDTLQLADELTLGRDVSNREYLSVVLRRSPYFEGVAVIDLESGRNSVAGKLDAALIERILSELTQRGHAAYIIEAMPKGQPIFLLGQYINDTLPSRSGQIILAAASFKAIQDLYKDTNTLGRTGESFLSDNHGRPLTPLRFVRQKQQAQPIRASAMQDCLRGNMQAAIIDPDYVDVPTLMSYRQIKGYGGCVMVHMRVSEVMAPLHELKRKIILSGVAEGIAVLLIAGFVARKILRTGKRLHRLATTDALTGVANRLLLMELLEMEQSRYQRFSATAALLMLDLDHFKQINDNYGHAVGDQVLQQFAGLIAQNLRHFDIFGRLGGEEFCILLPNTDINGGLQFAERLCQIIAATPAETDAAEIYYSVSIGVTAFLPRDNSVLDVIERADAALYQAKESGRNRAVGK